MKVRGSYYKDIQSIILENNELKVNVLPKIGGKIASIYSKRNNFEYLVQSPNSIYKRQDYDGVYVQGECSGFDDMFPTIDQCHYEEYPWAGTKLPDHGELWSIEWEQTVYDDSLRLAVYGIRLPYKFEKNLSLPDEHTLKIEYHLVNLSNFPLNFLWAAHIMINIEESTQLIMPKSVNKGVTVFSKSGRLGKYGDEFDWPVLNNAELPASRLDKSRSPAVKDMEKYYIKGTLDEGYCELRYPDEKRFILKFSVDTVPYLGILFNENGWTNNGVWNDLYNIFLEPCTATFDRIDVARLHNQCSVLSPKGKYSWNISIQV